jgi:hypothetical protein
MKKPIFPWGAGAAALVVVLLLAVPVRSPAATPDQNKLPAGARVKDERWGNETVGRTASLSAVRKDRT